MLRVNNMFARVLLVASSLFAGCTGGGGDMKKDEFNVDLPGKAKLEAVANMRIVFAHQSVGNDILGGISALAKKESVAINVEETRIAAADKRGFLHFKVGQNEQPQSKITDYVAALGEQDFAGVDVAMMKLCYIDFKAGTDAKQLAKEYASAIDLLQGKYPQTRFVAMTAPLTTIQTGPKAWLKRLMGKSPAGYDVNAVRQQFNDELRARFDQHRLFDIARVEAFAGDSPQIFSFNGRDNIEALDPALTYDGGHLNERGQQLVGAAMINFLSARK